MGDRLLLLIPLFAVAVFIGQRLPSPEDLEISALEKKCRRLREQLDAREKLLADAAKPLSRLKLTHSAACPFMFDGGCACGVKEIEALARAALGEGNTAEVCADCGIPLVWCRRVTSNPAHCWRWDYEQFDDMATERDALREALEAIANRHPDALTGEHPAVDIARAALAALGATAVREPEA